MRALLGLTLALIVLFQGGCFLERAAILAGDQCSADEDCPAGQICAARACVPGGEDAGPRDAGARDAGRVDAGRDAGLDAGHDAAEGGTVDAGPPELPTDGLLGAWIVEDGVILDGDRVTSISDLSPHGHDLLALATGGERPTVEVAPELGGGMVLRTREDGRHTLQAGSFADGDQDQPLTHVWVGQVLGVPSSGVRILVDKGAGASAGVRHLIGVHWGRDELRFEAGATVAVPSEVGRPVVLLWEVSGGSSRVFLDDWRTPVFMGDSGANRLRGYSLGGAFNGDAASADARHWGAFVYRGRLSDEPARLAELARYITYRTGLPIAAPE